MSDDRSSTEATHPSKALALEIPVNELESSVPSSIESSQTSSPTGILHSSSSNTTMNGPNSASCTSLPIRAQTLNVKFAPLPELAPRKRRSTAPLGMAARTQLVRRRRHHQYYDPDPGPQYGGSNHPQWTAEELAEARMRQVAEAMEKERQRSEARDENEEDPFMVFGRLVKGAGKQIWRKVAKKESTKDLNINGDKEKEKASEENKENSSSDRPADAPNTTPADSKETPADSKQDEADIPPRLPSPPKDPDPHFDAILEPSSEPAPVRKEPRKALWENGAESEFLRTVGQTETIVEGQPKYHIPRPDPEENRPADIAEANEQPKDIPSGQATSHKSETKES